jgi:hypothetical protein
MYDHLREGAGYSQAADSQDASACGNLRELPDRALRCVTKGNMAPISCAQQARQSVTANAKSRQNLAAHLPASDNAKLD